ncbi:MAG: hypothetical protein EOP83_26510 [Verrucomicrobiaceae bacterium]|nr:MAG: hypothetical protein EOP83_26510 [Verrucomicrobiaceae bacterium]
MRCADLISAKQRAQIKREVRYTYVNLTWFGYKKNIVEILAWLESPIRKGLFRTDHEMEGVNSPSPIIGVGIENPDHAFEFKMRFGGL